MGLSLIVGAQGLLDLHSVQKTGLGEMIKEPSRC